MARSGYFGDNEHRAFPFLDVAGSVLPDDAVVDFGCLVGPGAGFRSDEHSVYLDAVTLSGSTLTFVFRSDCPGLSDRTLEFTRETSGEAEYATQFSESDGGGCPGAALWDGYLATGELDALAAAVSDAGGDLAVGAVVEPALSQVLYAVGVTGVTLANREPPRVPDPCHASSSSFPSGRRTYTWAGCLTGDLRLVEGYNSALRVSAPENSITVGASKGGGAGEPCGDVSIRPGEDPAERQQCSDVILSVNGLAVRRLQLVGGLGSHVVPGPADAELTLLVDLRGISGSGNA